MAKLESLTINGVKYGSFPARPYYVDVHVEGGDGVTTGTYSTAETFENFSAVLEAGLLPVARVFNAEQDTVCYFMPDLIIGDCYSAQFSRGTLILTLKKNDTGGFDVISPYED